MLGKSRVFMESDTLAAVARLCMDQDYVEIHTGEELAALEKAMREMYSAAYRAGFEDGRLSVK